MSVKTFTPVRSPRLSEEIIRQIARLVELGQLKLNERFPSERTLQEEWGVSRPVLREAFRALEVQGMIESRPGGGRYLRSNWISEPVQHRQNRLEDVRSNLLEIWDARESIETKSAELAARHATDEDIAALARPLNLLKELPLKEAASVDFNREFHLVIARASRNSLIEEMVIRLVARSSEVGFREFLDAEDFVNLMLIYKPIYEAIARHDPKAARQAMVAHFDELRKSIEAT